MGKKNMIYTMQIVEYNSLISAFQSDKSNFFLFPERQSDVRFLELKSGLFAAIFSESNGRTEF